MNTNHSCQPSGQKMRSKKKAAPVKIDIERMDSALDTEFFTMPTGLNIEQMRQYIIECARKK